MQFVNLDACQAYADLRQQELPRIGDSLTMENIQRYDVAIRPGLRFNYAARGVNQELLDRLQQVADEQQVVQKYRQLLLGERYNTGEDRLVLHHLLRAPSAGSIIVDGQNIGEFYQQQLQKIAAFSRRVHQGEITGASGAKFDTVVQVGIGGSDLGPRALYLALEHLRAPQLRAHFISNVDPDDAASVLAQVRLERTLVVLVSKSGTTQETLTNEKLVRQFFSAQGLDSSRHLLAVTSATSPLANNPNYLDSFYIDDYIGGRYSATSAVGAVLLALAFGYPVVEQILDGAHQADLAALNPDIRSNAALVDALLGVVERNLRQLPATAVLPYSQALVRFPAHLQQLDMESNGKSVNRDGQPLAYQTGPLVFGEPGTNGQHSFYQLLHQGTTIVPLQFIGFGRSQMGVDTDFAGSSSQRKLQANLVAQIFAFARGRDNDNPNKKFAGQRPSSLIYGQQLTAANLGALLAHFENKVMFQGLLWNINSFDQEGVQLGKILTEEILSGGGSAEMQYLMQLLNGEAQISGS